MKRERKRFELREEREKAVAMAVRDVSRERREEKKKNIKIILFNLAQNSTSSERYPKITENREYYAET